MDKVLSMLGPEAIIPVAMVSLAGYAITMLVGVMRTRGQRRVEFLNLWKGAQNMDDMELEVTVRHLTGTYLPSPVIRKVCAQPGCAEGLLDLSLLSDLFKFEIQGVRPLAFWAKPGYATWWGLCWREWAWLFAYVGIAVFSYVSLMLAFAAGPGKAAGWIWGLNALLFAGVAFAALARSEILGAARSKAAGWFERLNKSEDSGAQIETASPTAIAADAARFIGNT